jgi:HK97 family phage major capsid protein
VKNKKKRLEEEEIDEDVDEEEEVDEEELAEEEEEIEKGISNTIDKKIDKIVQAVRDNPVRKSYLYNKEEPSKNKSVLEIDPFIRRKRPFVKLSKQMDSFISDVRTIARGGYVKALSEGDDTAGGFTVPEEFHNEIIRYQTESAIVRPRARVFNMTRDRWRAPKLDQNTTTDTALTGGEHFSGVHFYYTDEGDTKTESEPRFGQIVLVAKKLVGLTVASDELLEDSAVNLANYLVTLFGEALAYREDYEYLRGTGVGRPLGVLNAAGTSVVARNTSSQILLDDVLGLYSELPAWADKNAVWLTTKAGMEQLLWIGNTNTTQKIQLLFPSLQEGIPVTMLGKPLLLTDKLPAVASEGAILYGDFSRYYIGDRGTIKIDSSIHDRFRQDETVIRIVKRHDGQPAIDNAFAILGA